MPNAPSWLLVAALVLLMQVGFALVTTGLCRAKNASQIVAANLMILVCAVLGFWIAGFAFLGGPGGASVAPGFFFNPAEKSHDTVPLFLVGALLVSVAAVIPAGAMAERWSIRNIILYAFWAGILPIAIFGRWIWGGGWLARLGQSMNLGHGAVDLAGSSVIHMGAGAIALVGSLMLGPRAGKYTRDGRPRPMPGHNLVNVIIGSLILFAGWFGFNAARADFNPEIDVAVVALNTLLAGAAGGFAAYVTTVRSFGKPDPSMLCNGILAGLVSISAACGFVNSTAAVLTGAVAGFVVVHSVVLFETRFNVDDPVGAISVHGVCGVWGMLSLGLFANGRYGAGWNGVHSTDAGVTGALGKLFGAPGNDWSQLGAQCVAIVAGLLFIGAISLVWFKLSNLISPMRLRRDLEIGGLNLPETGADCYPDFHLTDKSQTGV